MLGLVFFLSGATALVYESVWGRELHLVFGTSQFAIATVLAAFMTGLALGGAIATRLVHRVTRPLRVYAALEAVVALYALVFPWVRAAIEPLYLSLDLGPVAFGVAQFALVTLALLVPTTCMGATLPLLVRFVGRADVVGRLYALNTGGAVVGTWLAGFFLLPALHVRDTTVATAVVNLALAGLALAMDRQADPVDRPAAAEVPYALLAVAALAGFSSLAMEVAWFRVLTLVLGASTYAFTVMLLAFLAGIAIGGELGGRWTRGLVAAQIGVAALSWGAMWLYQWLPLTFVKLWFVIEPMPELIWPMKCALAMALMVPPALLMGATFPLLVRAATTGDASRPTGAIYAANTLGSIAGAFSAGFVLLPQLNVTGTVLLCCGVNLVAAAIASRRAIALVPAVAAAGALWLAPPPWDPMMMTSGVYKYVDNLEEPTLAEMRRRFVDRYELLYYEEGLSTVVTVARNRATGNVWLANNGKIDASTTTDMPTQVLVAHTPFLFTGDDARDAMLIGLASGITLGALALHPELERVDVVELEPAMPEAAALFKRWNRDALADPRVRVLANDGRNQLLRTPPGTYDVVVAEPSNPWLTGVSNLFTREFFEMGKARLKPGGVWSQWVQMYGMDARDLRSVIRTFCDVFPHVLLFSTIRDADLVMIGSDRPLSVDAALAERLVAKNVGVEGEMAQIGVLDGYDLLSHYLFDRDVAMEMTEGTPLNTDDNLLVEFSAPKNLHRETSGENFLMLLPHARTPLEGIPTADGLLRLAQAYDWRDDTVRALIALKEAEKREPGRPDTLALYTAYQKKLAERLR
ncbi:MAG: fused MFS/spermidine synthase [Myxococcota bacterium]